MRYTPPHDAFPSELFDSVTPNHRFPSQMSAPSEASDELLSQFIATLYSSAESDPLKFAISEQCEGKCGEVGPSTLLINASESTTTAKSSSTIHNVNYLTWFHTVSITFALSLSI